MRKVLWTPHYRPALDTTLLSRLWTLTLPDSSPSNASGHQIAVAQACGLKLNLHFTRFRHSANKNILIFHICEIIVYICDIRS